MINSKVVGRRFTKSLGFAQWVYPVADNSIDQRQAERPPITRVLTILFVVPLYPQVPRRHNYLDHPLLLVAPKFCSLPLYVNDSLYNCVALFEWVLRHNNFPFARVSNKLSREAVEQYQVVPIFKRWLHRGSRNTNSSYRELL